MPDSMHKLMPPVPLRDGRIVTIRPLQSDDKTRLLHFGEALPQDDWTYLEHDLRSPEIVARLCNAASAEHWRQMVALDGSDTIASYASVRMLAGRTSHVAMVKLVIADAYRRVGLGTAMGEVIFNEAKRLSAHKVVVEMLEAQKSGQAIFARLGFRIEGTLKAHVRDRFGQRHTLVVMSALT